MFKDFVLNKEYHLYQNQNTQKEVLYEDGVEDALLTVLQNQSDLSVHSDALKTLLKSWVFEYHFSSKRSVIIDSLGIQNQKLAVLELGAGCGAVTRYLGEQFHEIHAVEGTLSRAKVARERCRDLSNVSVYVGNIFELEPLKEVDIVCLVGVLEYSHLFHPIHQTPKAAALSTLEQIYSYMKPNSLLILAIENKMGLKYFSGATEDHSSKRFESIQGYPCSEGAHTFSKYELEEMFKAANFSDWECRLPFPDYKLTELVLKETDISPELYLPNWIKTPFRDYIVSRPVLFNETLLIDTLVKSKLLAELSNSFLYSIYKGDKETVQESFKMKQDTILNYYNYNRPKQYCKKLVLEKNNMIQCFTTDHRPSISIQNGKLGFNPESTPFKKGFNLQFLIFQYSTLATETFQKKLIDLLQKYKDFIRENFSIPNSKQISGAAIDITVWNILENPETKEWQIIDTEWCWQAPISMPYLLFRNIYHLLNNHTEYFKSLLTDKKISAVIYDILNELKDDNEVLEMTQYVEMESQFQNTIKGLS